MPSESASTITPTAFQALLARYPSLVPPKLQPLDTLRHETLPTTLAARRKTADLHLTPSEALSLVDWKLSHGTFRPRLRQLVASNPDIESVTRDAYVLLDADASEPSVRAALKAMTELKGVGPATASLFLAVAEARVPFFSDEVFRWTAGDWGREIKYSPGEYGELIGRVRAVADRLAVEVREVECVAWVLGRERKGGDVPGKKRAAEAEGGRGARRGRDEKGEEEAQVGRKKRTRRS